ncbi:MAG TPA: Ig-like domain-containing protein [Candidatus Sulfotelmatobacter sp.]
MQTKVASTLRLFLLRLALCAGILSLCVLTSRAGGPARVTGSAYFDPTVEGRPLTWPQGRITYYVDQGNLSPVLPNSDANTLVASAFSQWTSVPTAALSVTAGGSLGEDVSGANVTRNSDGTISMPPDVQPNATGTPVGIVYDSDGAVTSALLGAGAADRSQCFYNAVFGGNDDYGPFATYQHALLVINGQCAQQASQVSEIQYRLVRAVGNVLGVGWSQLNVNVQTGSPPPTADDYAGFPVMHFLDLWNCVPITLCYPHPTTISMDDIAAISRLYPVTAQNQAAFPGKQIFSAGTARIHGSVWFTDTHGQRSQPMQGVNVVARWIDPATGQPSRRYAASSVSGFLFTGNQGNPITGTEDAMGEPLSRWGSHEPELEGEFDLSGLQLPNGVNTQYQLSVEALDPQWSYGVGPYSPDSVSPSGSFLPITITVSPGSNVLQDILMTGTAQPLPQSPSSWSTPAPLPVAGDWVSSLRQGAVQYFQLSIQANRTLSITATALNESSRATLLKARPVIGMWASGHPEGTPSPAFTPSPFNSVVLATSRLDAQVLQAGNFLIGISDLRRDGRPDFRYHGRVLYADTLSPARVGVNGGTITVRGTGFARGLSATMGGTTLTQLRVSATEIMLSVPARSDGTQSITLTDSTTGASTTMANALTYGAAANDNIILLYSGNSQTPVGTQAAKPVTVRVLAADGVTAVSGVTVGWTTTNSLQLSACGGATSCSVTTDQSGSATTWLTPAALAAATVTAVLAPGVYSPAKSVTATLNAIGSASDVAAVTPNLRISQGATVTLPLLVRAVNNGSPRTGVQINYAVMTGSGTLGASSAATHSSGYASVNLTLNQITAETKVSACVAPSNAPCAIFYADPVPLSQQRLQSVSGAGQVSTGQAFQPIIVRVTDSAATPNAVIAAPVLFQTTVLRPGGTSPGVGDGETNTMKPSQPVILQVAQSTATSDVNGFANIVPSRSSFSPPLLVDVWVTAGSTALLDLPLQVLPPLNAGSSRSGASSEPTGIPIRDPRWRGVERQ